MIDYDPSIRPLLVFALIFSFLYLLSFTVNRRYYEECVREGKPEDYEPVRLRDLVLVSIFGVGLAVLLDAAWQVLHSLVR